MYFNLTYKIDQEFARKKDIIALGMLISKGLLGRERLQKAKNIDK